jgi:hypothetical protein
MNGDSPDYELDRLIEELLDGIPPEGDLIDFIERITREVKGGRLDDHEVELRLEQGLRALRIAEVHASGSIAGLVDSFGNQISELDGYGENLNESQRLVLDAAVKVRAILQEMRFPSERLVSAYHCPRELVTDSEALQEMLDQTSERFDQTTPGVWQSRDSGLCCHCDPERFFDNLRITSRTLRWDEQLPNTLDYLLAVRNCVAVRDTNQLDFIQRAFPGDHQVQELLAIARRANEQKELAIREQRFDDAGRQLDEYDRVLNRLNRLCIERDQDSC